MYQKICDKSVVLLGVFRKLFAVIRRRHAYIFAEIFVKVRHGRKSAVKGNVTYRHVAFAQPQFGFFQSTLHCVFHYRYAARLFERVYQRTLGAVKDFGKFVYGNLLVEVRFDVTCH